MTDQTTRRPARSLRCCLATAALTLGALVLAGPVLAAGEVLIHQLEWQDRTGGDALKWDVSGWLGSDHDRVWLRDEGDHARGDEVENRVELLWGHPLARWEFLAGVRHDSGRTPSRTYGAVGGQMRVRDSLRLEAMGYLGEGSDKGNKVHAGARLQADWDYPLGRGFALAARGEFEIWSEDHVRYTDGVGPSQVNGGLRLQYTLAPALSPYVGVEWLRLLGDTADLEETAGRPAHESRLVAGLRLQF
ncbi:MAG: copper resistance protein B [Gammaproteobacteria bacterium]|jgi:copper resistance protein B|nr:copper resistance protein B [Gammaproteobacteria bacterium]